MIERKRLAAVNGTANTTATQDNGCASPMGMLEGLPEVSVPMGSLVPGSCLRAPGVAAARVQLPADAPDSVRLPSILVQKSRAGIFDGMHRTEVGRLSWKYEGW